jgi:hypothetical protein
MIMPRRQPACQETSITLPRHWLVLYLPNKTHKLCISWNIDIFLKERRTNPAWQVLCHLNQSVAQSHKPSMQTAQLLAHMYCKLLFNAARYQQLQTDPARPYLLLGAAAGADAGAGAAAEGLAACSGC